MVVLGIDPGSRACGWGAVTRERGGYRRVASGVIRTRPDDPMAERLRCVHDGLRDAIAATKPEVAALEAIFAHKSATSALVLGQARGVALLAAAEASVPVCEYNTQTVKKCVTGSGKSDKAAVGRMVGRLLGVDQVGGADEADALALAMTHLAHAGLAQAVRAATRR
jgi:crossover junction endodeoxyribonuclease RuvC